MLTMLNLGAGIWELSEEDEDESSQIAEQMLAAKQGLTPDLWQFVGQGESK